MKYSFKLAGGRGLLGIAVAIVPAVIAWLVAKSYVDDVDATFIAAGVSALASGLGVDAHAYRQSKGVKPKRSARFGQNREIR